MDLLSTAAGAAGVGVAYFLYLCATKGLPAAWAWAMAKWNAGAAAAKVLQQDIDAAHERITAMETKLNGLVAAAQASPGTLQASLQAAPPRGAAGSSLHTPVPV